MWKSIEASSAEVASLSQLTGSGKHVAADVGDDVAVGCYPSNSS